jgi:inosine-uridine nucleoside N-ribohydrolase
LFEVLESVPPASLDADFDAAVTDAIALIGGSGSKLRGYTVAAANVSSANGVRVVKLTLSMPSSKKAPLIIQRAINSFSEETVDDVDDDD